MAAVKSWTSARAIALTAAMALAAASCSTGGSEAGTTTTRAGTSRSTTTTAPAVKRPPPLGAQPDGEVEPPVRLFLAPAGAGTEGGAASNLHSLRQGQAKGPVRLGGATAPGWHTIDRSTPSKSKGSRQETYPAGTRREFDADDNDLAQWNPDGSFDSSNGDGSSAHIDHDGGYVKDPKNGTFDSYDPDGNHVHLGPDGDYVEDPNGTRTFIDPDGGSTEISQPTYPDDIGKQSSGGAGEPHLLSEDGIEVTTQILGEFVYSTGVTGQEVQARTEPWNDSKSAAAITALAFGVDDQRVAIHVDGSVTVDGQDAPKGRAEEFGFDEGGAVGVWRDSAGGPATTVVVVWPDLSAAYITPHGGWLDLRLQWREATGDRRGVLGSDDGDPSNDLTLRDGTSGSEAEVEDFVRSWEVTSDESLFDYPSGKTTADYLRTDFPEQAPSPADDDEAANKACRAVPAGFARDSCRYDVAVTGSDDFVKPYGAYGRALAGDRARLVTAAAVRKLIAKFGSSAGGSTTTTGSATTTTTKAPRVGTAIALTGTDRAGAKTADGDAIVEELDAGASATYLIEVAKPSRLGAISQNLACPNEPYRAGDAGYAFFAEDGTVVSGPRKACDDDPDDAAVDPGNYYLKLVGPGAVAVTLEIAEQ